MNKGLLIWNIILTLIFIITMANCQVRLGNIEDREHLNTYIVWELREATDRNAEAINQVNELLGQQSSAFNELLRILKLAGIVEY